ncbi:MAG: hypothetical protein UW18_C0003G0227 [Microgenomates group bacterium GW2011_GWF1_44_10]|nr:MAG: hypothetical protein UW18_C0003G0227 [Microgenomates group bacterium GW2011_GWF1_44_10]
MRVEDARAEESFRASIVSTYHVQVSGITEVDHEIHLENEFSTIYASQYELTINADKLEFVHAEDQLGVEIPVRTSVASGSTTVALQFEDKVVGKGKERVFHLRYHHPDLVIKTGSTAEVAIPKLLDSTNLDSYQVSIYVPQQFGELAYSSIQSFVQDQKESLNVFTYTQGAKNGVRLLFGLKQVYTFTLQYYLENTTVSQGIFQIALPPDTSFQKIVYSSITPTPESIVRDEDGNWIASLSLSGKKADTVVVEGVAYISVDPFVKIPQEQLGKYVTSPTSYWQSNHADIVSLANKLQSPRAMYEYLVNSFQYDYTRLSIGDGERRGAIRAFQSPSNVLCREFTDAFVALSRARNVPAREVNGYAYTTNKRLRPLSYEGTILHAWPEYFDADKNIWIPIDPTWGNTTGGTDYFSKLDFAHITFVLHSKDDSKPFSAGLYSSPDKTAQDVSVELSQLEIPHPELNLELEKPFVGKPNVIRVKNNTGAAWYSIPVSVIPPQGFTIQQGKVTQIPVLLPFQVVEYEVPIEQSKFSFLPARGEVTISIGGKEVQYEAQGAGYTSLILIGSISGVALVAGGVLVFRRKR